MTTSEVEVAAARPTARARAVSLRTVGLALFAGAVLAAPLGVAGDDYYLTLLILGSIYVIFTLGQTLLLGYTGQVSLGHAAFYGIGAYTTGSLATRVELPFPVTLLLSMALPGLLAYVMGRPLLRLQPFYLAMATLVVGIAASEVFHVWKPVTGGTAGLVGIPPPQLGPFAFDTPLALYELAAVLALLCLAMATALVRTHVGRALRAIRSDEGVAAASGIDVQGYKTRIFALSAALAGMAGALYAHFASYISPETFNLDLSILVVAMAVIGGLGGVPGAVVGALFLVAFPEMTRQFGEVRDLIYGTVLFVMLVFVPRGIWGLIVDLARRASRMIAGLARSRGAGTGKEPRP